jgi:hypothetical protein
MKKQQLIDIYSEHISSYDKELNRRKRQRNLITLFKLLSFAGILYTFYLFVSATNTEMLYLSIGLLATFIVLTIIDTRVVSYINMLKALIRCNKTEINYLYNDFTDLDRGDKYIDATHNYTSDLDIFGEESVFQAINRTVTYRGADKLAGFLSNPSVTAEQIKERQDAVAELSEDLEWRHMFCATGMVNKVSEFDDDVIDRWQDNRDISDSPLIKYMLYLFNILTPIVLAGVIFSFVSIHIFIFLFLLQLFITVLFLRRVNRLHRELDGFVKSVGNYYNLIKLINNRSFTTGLLKQIKAKLFREDNTLTAFYQLKRLLGAFDQRGNVLVAFLFNGLFMRDIHTMLRLNKWKARYLDKINNWIEQVSSIDSLISMANYRYNHPEFSVPDISDNAIIKAESLGHPLLRNDEMVTNDFGVESVNNIFIVTGANMAGKSTFLRAVGVNMVLALSGNVVCSGKFEFKPISIFSSMRTTDNLAKGRSYFHAELLRLKQLINEAKKGQPLFVILDEMLKGTNSKDKLNGSVKFLKRILELPISGLVATHDLAIGKLNNEYPDNFINVCFEIEHVDDNIIYDYKLKPGVSKTMNASILMDKMGLL